MPELPEVETMRRCIAPVCGRTIRDVQQPPSKLQPIKISPRLSTFRRRVIGRRIVAVERLGKRVLLRLDSDERIVFEPRMSGLVLLADPPDREHLRLVFDLSGRPVRRILFWNMRGLGVVSLLSPRRFAEQLGPGKLGPDALEMSAEELRRRLQSSRRAVKVALLDQQVLAGIGNLYASEILHRIGVHPELSCNRLRRTQWQRLQVSIQDVLQEAIAHQGSTLGDGTYRVAKNEPGNFQVCHRVYGREGESCITCGKAAILRIVQTQRSTFFCPRCQRR